MQLFPAGEQNELHGFSEAPPRDTLRLCNRLCSLLISGVIQFGAAV